MRSLKSKFRRICWPWSPRRSDGYQKMMRRQLCQEPLESRMLLSVSPSMIDLDSATYSNPSDFVTIGEVMYFVAEDTDHGRELWATDGTEDGTYLVKDINDGADSSNLSQLTEFDGKLYFAADDGEHGEELWMSDGTESGTVMVKDINPGTGNQYPYGNVSLSSFPRDLTVVDGVLYFGAEDADHGAELWKTDGTAAGTTMVKDIQTGTFTYNSNTYPNSSNASNMIAVGDTLFFVADNGNGMELWKSDGTAAGTVMVKDIYTGTFSQNDETYPNSSNPTNMTVVDGVLFFVAEDADHGLELWKSDGTESGTTLVADINSGTDSAFTDISSLVAMDGVLYFTADDGTHGDELWRSDGTSSGTYLVKDINPGSEGNLSYYTGFTVVGDTIYFAADDGEHGKELWKTDGTASGTVLVKDINLGDAESFPYFMTSIDDVLFFSAKTEEHGRELWKSDGTTEGTVMLVETISGSTGILPEDLQVVGSHLVFSGYVDSDRELYTYDLEAPARLSIWVDGQEVTISDDIGVYSGGGTADVYTTDDDGTLQVTAGSVVTLEDFFTLWRTNAGLAGNNADATFDDDELMGNTASGDYTVQMFVNGQVRTDFEDYTIAAGDEIILVYTENTVVSINTNYGSIVMELFDDDTPITVNNFLQYINDGDYLQSIFHRSVTDFVIQGGGFTTSSETFTNTSQFSSIPSNGTIQSEAGISNTYGTVAMARQTGVNTATSQFFINLVDNDGSGDTNLDTLNGGYTVFGQVLDMTAAEIIGDLPIHNTGVSPYQELPYDDATDQLVVVESIAGIGTVTGHKFHDTNGNGVFDNDESGIEGVKIYSDANGNGTWDEGEAYTTTDQNGEYVLNLPAGAHTIRAEVTSGNMASVEYYNVNLEIAEVLANKDLGEQNLPAPTGVDLVSTSDTGAADDDNITQLNNSSGSTMQFVVTGVTVGAEVRLYSDGTLIGSATAGGSSVTITTNGEVTLTDGEHQITAVQMYGAGQSEESDALAVTIDTTAPAAIASTAPDVAQILVEYTFDADSPDEGDEGITYSLVGAPSGMTIDADTGEISWTPTADQAVPQEFDIVVSDAAGNTSVQTVDMTVLGVIAAYADSYIAFEDDPLSIPANTGVLANDDPNNAFGTLTVTLIDGPEHGTVQLDANGAFIYTPDANYYGTDSFTYQATDGTDVSNVAKVTISVTGEQDAPVGEEDSYETDEDTVLSVNADEGVLANDEDADGDELTATLHTAAAHGVVVLKADGSFVYTPNENYSGTDSFTYKLSDGTTTTDPITVEITVTGTNDAPTGVNDSYTLDEEEDFSVDAAGGVLANDTDPEDDTLTATLVSNVSHGTLDFETDGSFTYTPDDDYVGTDTFTYKVSDGTNTSSTVTVTLTVENTSDDPVAEDDEFDVENDGTLHSLDVLDNDSDVDPSDSLSITAVTQGSDGGTVTISGGVIKYKPASGFTGTETFTYTIEDEAGNEATATVTMTVTEDGNGESGESGLSGYVFIDVDGDGEFDSGDLALPGVLITLTGTSDAGNSVSLTRLTDDNGYYLFDNLPAGTYKLTEQQPTIVGDGADSSSDSGATVGNDVISAIDLDEDEAIGQNNFGESVIKPGYITVRMFFASTTMHEYLRSLVAYGEELAGNTDLADDIRNGETDYTNADNHAPVANSDSYSVDENTTLTKNASNGVLDNDTDADGDTLTASLVSDVSHGELVLNSNGSFTYTPDTNYAGTDSFTYKAYDGTSWSNTVTVTITVDEGNDAPVAVADSYPVDEDEVLNVSAAAGVLKNDTDSDDSNLEAVLVSDVSHGTLELDDDGSFVYTPNSGYSGTDTFTYYATDGTNNSNTVTVTITVGGVNDAPVASPDAYEIDENNVLTVNATQGVLANDDDEEDEDLTAHLVSGPANGSVTLNADGSFEYTPNVNYAGTDTFTYRAKDGSQYSDPVTVTITVHEGEDAPVAADDAYTIAEDTTLSKDDNEGVLANDTDADGDSLEAVLMVAPQHGSVTLEDDGSFEYVPDENYYGTDTFTYYATDGELQSGETTVTITITPVNDAPEGVDDVYTVLPNGELNIDADGGVLANDSDVEESTLSASLVADVQHGTLSLDADGSFDYEPAAGYHGIDTFTYKVYDGELYSETVTVEIHVNTPAEADDEAYSVDEDTVLSIDAGEGLLVGDSDADGDDLTAVLVTAPAHGTVEINEDGSFTYTPNANYTGTDTFTYAADDGYADPTVATVTITIDPINDAPTGVDDIYTASENTKLSIDAAAGVLKNDGDVDGDSLEAVLIDGPANGTLVFNDDGSFEYTPNVNFSGTDTFTYRADDGELLSSLVTVTITVEEGNDAPVGADDHYTVALNGTLDLDAAAGVLANDIDGDDDTLTVILVSGPERGELDLEEDGSFTYEPDADYHGTDSFRYKVSDGTHTSEIITVRIDVNDPADAQDDAYSVDEDGTLTVPMGEGVLDNDDDPNDDMLLAVLVTGPAHGTLELNNDGSFTYKPDADYFGEDSFVYAASDDYINPSEATVTITVNPIPDDPVGVEDGYTIAVDGTLDVDAAAGVLANDTDADGDSLTATKLSDPQHGSLTFYDDGSFIYEPTSGYHGEDSFTYKVDDGTTESEAITVTIHVNTPADAQDDTYTMDEGTTLQVVAGEGVLDNDSDADSDDLTAVLKVDAEHGTVVLLGNGSFTYTPDDPDFYGTDTFTYEAQDGYREPTIATVTITIEPTNDAPVGTDDAYTVLPGVKLEIDAAEGVLANDEDIDGDSLSVTLVDDVAHGQLTLESDGSFSYEPTSGYHGEDTFTYKINDGTEDSEVVTVTIHVNTPADAVDDTGYEMDEDGQLSIDEDNGVLANDSDADGDNLTVEIVTGPSHGTIQLAENGSFVYEPDDDFTGVDSFTYVVKDGYMNPSEATVTITVNPVNDAPVATGETFSVDEDTILDVNADQSLLLNDTDIDGDSLTVTLVTDVQNGTLTLEDDGTFEYEPDPDFHGTDTFTYVVNDGTLDSNEVTVTLTVDPVNDAPVGVDDEYTVLPGGTLDVDAAGGVLANDEDVEDDTLSATLVANVEHGELTFNPTTGSFVYTPTAGYHGDDSFTYIATDTVGNSEETTVTLHVNSPVSAVDDSYDATENEQLIIAAIDGVLANDEDGDDDPLEASLITGPSHGQLALNADGSFTYTPDTDYTGDDSFTYLAEDDYGGYSEATVTISVDEAMASEQSW